MLAIFLVFFFFRENYRIVQFFLKKDFKCIVENISFCTILGSFTINKFQIILITENIVYFLYIKES